MWAGFHETIRKFWYSFHLLILWLFISLLPLFGFAWRFEDRYASTIKFGSYRCLRWILDNVVHSYELSLLQVWWRGNTTPYITADYNILKYADTPSNMPQIMLKSIFIHHFYQYSFSVLGIDLNIHIYTYTGHMAVMLEYGGNFENGIPIPDYQIHLVLGSNSILLKD